MVEIILDAIQQAWLDFQQGILPDLGGWNYMLMAVLMMVQGRLSALVGGIAAASGYLNLGLIILVALAARAAVDVFWYRVGSTSLIDRIGHHTSRYEKYSTQITDGITNRPTRLVLLSKTIGGLAIPVTIAIGNARVPLRRWLPASILGELFWTLPLLLLGFFATDAIANIKGGVMYLTLGMTALFLFINVLKFLRSKMTSSRQPQ